MKELILIAAVGNNNVLGKDNKLLWHLPDDFKHFKESTMGHPMLMGRKTFESLPGVLANRKHLIISRDLNYTIENQNCSVVHSIEQGLEECKEFQNVFVIGGGQIYAQCIEIATKIILTRVNGDFEADTYFPTIDESLWKQTESIYHPKDAKHAFDFTIETYVRR